jgi:hypothetical protein
MVRRILTAAIAASALALPTAATAQQAGLVNVDVSNVLNNLTIKEVLSRNNVVVDPAVAANVQVPIALAAPICGTTVAVLAQGGSAAECDADAQNMTEGQATALANAIIRAQQGKGNKNK